MIQIPTWILYLTIFDATKNFNIDVFPFHFQATESYSGSDICLLCKEAAMRPVRKIFDILENREKGEILIQFIPE